MNIKSSSIPYTTKQLEHPLDTRKDYAYDTEQARRNVITMLRQELTDLDEYVASIADALNDLCKQFKDTAKTVKRMQQDMYD